MKTKILIGGIIVIVLLSLAGLFFIQKQKPSTSPVAEPAEALTAISDDSTALLDFSSDTLPATVKPADLDIVRATTYGPGWTAYRLKPETVVFSRPATLTLTFQNFTSGVVPLVVSQSGSGSTGTSEIVSGVFTTFDPAAKQLKIQVPINHFGLIAISQKTGAFSFKSTSQLLTHKVGQSFVFSAAITPGLEKISTPANEQASDEVQFNSGTDWSLANGQLLTGPEEVLQPGSLPIESQTLKTPAGAAIKGSFTCSIAGQEAISTGSTAANALKIDYQLNHRRLVVDQGKFVPSFDRTESITNFVTISETHVCR